MTGWNAVTGVVSIAMGVAIAVVWTRDIITADRFDVGIGRLRARSEAGDLLLPHWIAEYATAALLMLAGILVLRQVDSRTVAAGLAAGALAYTSVNSLGWALAEPDRRLYAIPMAAGLVVAAWLTTYAVTT